MMARIIILVVVTTVTLSNVDFALAQKRGKYPVNQTFRLLGGGWSGGYHWRNPGYKVDYYNPYSHHNSQLRIGVVPQGASRYLGQMGGVACPSNQNEVNSFDQIGTIYQDGFNTMPDVIYSTAPANSNGTRIPTPGSQKQPQSPAHVVDSEVMGEENGQPKVDYRSGPENPSSNRKSVIDQPDTKGNQPSPSDRSMEKKDDVGMWKGFDELESTNRSFVGGGR